MRCHFPLSRQIATGLVMSLLLGLALQASADDSPESLPFEEATRKDLATWRDLLRKGDYDALEKIGDDLRVTSSKYSNGRGRLWRFVWSAMTDDHGEMKEEDFTRSFEWLNGWLKAKPKSINARLSLANVWEKYAFFARGGRMAPDTPDAQLDTFAGRSAKASKYLDEIADMTKAVDNVYRRLRIDLSKGAGKKPERKHVYDGLKDDPKNMELVHGMAICLLPRWFGEPGELEEFADEVVRRTKDTCGEMHYTTAAIASKEFLKSYLLDEHKFDWQRLRQGLRDLERMYPHSRECLNDEAQFAFMAGDLNSAYAVMAKIGDHPRRKSWEQTEISFDGFRQRVTPEMMQGDQKQLILGHVRPVMALETLGEGKAAVSVNWESGIRMHDVATGERRGWIWMQGVRGDSASIHPKTALLAAGSDDDPGVMIYNFANGQSGGLSPSEAKVVNTTFSPKGDLLAVADAPGVVVVFDLKTGKAKHEFPAKSKRDITGLAFSSNAANLAVTCSSGDLSVFDLTGDKPEDTRKISNHSLRSVAWSDLHLAVGTTAGEVHVLDGTTFKEVFAWKTDLLEVASLAFSPDGEKLAIGVRSKEWDTPIAAPLLVWNFRKDKIPLLLKGHKLGVNCVRFANRGKTLVSGSNDWTIRIWDVP